MSSKNKKLIFKVLIALTLMALISSTAQEETTTPEPAAELESSSSAEGDAGDSSSSEAPSSPAEGNAGDSSSSEAPSSPAEGGAGDSSSSEAPSSPAEGGAGDSSSSEGPSSPAKGDAAGDSSSSEAPKPARKASDPEDDTMDLLEQFKIQNVILQENVLKLLMFLKTKTGPIPTEHDEHFNDIRERNPNEQLPKSCIHAMTVFADEEGPFSLNVTKTTLQPFFAYCFRIEQNENPWMRIQYRFDGSVNFDRSWKDYKWGFGDVYGEHWLGLERIHQMTTARNHELIISIVTFAGVQHFAHFRKFTVASEAEGYRLTIGGCDTDVNFCAAILRENGLRFSTTDSEDNDRDRKNCAQICRGGWWYEGCRFCTLNSPYGLPDKRPEYGLNWATGHIRQHEIWQVFMAIRKFNIYEYHILQQKLKRPIYQKRLLKEIKENY